MAAHRWFVLLFVPCLMLPSALRAVPVNFASGPGMQFELVNDGGLWTVDANGSALRITKPADNLAFRPQGFIAGGLRSLFRVDGNFTVTVDYDLTDFPRDPSTPSTLNECIVGVGRGNRFLEVLRYVEGSSDTQLIEAFGSNGAPIGSRIVPEEARWHGRFRLSRSGDIVSAWFALPAHEDFTFLGSLGGLTGSMDLFMYAEQGLDAGSTRAHSSLDITLRDLLVDGLAVEDVATTTFAVFTGRVVSSIAFPKSPNPAYPAFLYATTRKDWDTPNTGWVHAVSEAGTSERLGADTHDDLYLAFGNAAFGDTLYGADPSWPGSHPDGVYGIRADGAIHPFNLLGGGNPDASGMAFTDGGSFGSFLYIASPGTGAGDPAYRNTIARLDPSGAFAGELLASPYSDGPWRVALSPGGTFGDYMYFGNLFSNRLCRATPSGAVDVFLSLPHNAQSDIAFGLGGEFGHDLYVAYAGEQEIYRIDENRNASLFATDIEATDLAFDPDSKDLFVTDGSRGTILRIHPGAGIVGPVAEWRCNEGSGTALGDSSGYGNHGALVGATWTAGVAGTGLAFDGAGARVDVGDRDGLEGMSALTLALWAKFDAFGSPGFCGPNCMPIVSKWYSIGSLGRNSYVLTEQGGVLQFTVSDGSNVVDQLTAPHMMEIGHWYHIAVTFDHGSTVIYVDGVPVGSGVLGVTSIANSTESLRIGDWWHTYDPTYRTFDGTMDEIRIYRRALGAEEIQNLFESVPTTAHLLAPNGGEVWTPGSQALAWTFAGPAPDHWAIAYTTDNHFYRPITTVPGATTSWIWSAPPIGTTHLRIRVQACADGGAVLNQDISDADNVLWNPVGVAFEYLRLNETESEPRAVVVWDEEPQAVRYQLTLEEMDGTSCTETAGFPRPYTINASPQGVMPHFFEVPSPDWETMAAAKWKATIQAYNAGGGQIGQEQVRTFIKCRLGDLDPYDTETKMPVILVHGWTSNSSTWFENDACRLKDALIAGDGDPSHTRHPWTFEYPNIGGIAESGAGLGEAITYIENLSTHESVQLVAHSMGGLVCHAYVQSLANAPATGLPYPAFRQDVTRLATLSSPHLGEPFTFLAAWIQDLLGCDGAGRSQSFQDLSDHSELIGRLADEPLPGSVQYFFAAGTDYHGEQLGTGTVRRRILQDICGYGNDATVDVCSARGGDCEGLHRKRHLNTGSATIIRATYDLAHGRMSKPGVSFGGNHRTHEAERLLNDVLGFLRCGPCLQTASCPPYRPTMVELDVRRLEQERPGPLKSRGTGGTGITKNLRSRERQGTVPAIGVTVRVRSIESTDPAQGIADLTDASGKVSVELLQEGSIIDISGPGVVARSDTLAADSLDGNLTWSLDLTADAAYRGPQGPALIINDNAECTADSVVSIALQCEDATEYEVSAVPSFDGAAWQPLTDHVPFTVHDGPGRNVVYARFRDGEGHESPLVWSSIVYDPVNAGQLLVTSSIPGASVIVNGRDSGRTTPATFDGLAPGFYYVSTLVSGAITTPGLAVVPVSGEPPATATFSVVPSRPPGAVDLASLGETDYLTGSPFRWAPVADPDSGDVVFYDVVVSSDSTQTTPLWTRSGVTGDCVGLARTLPDSLVYFVSVRSIDGHGTTQDGFPGSRRFSLDYTAPSLRIDRPSNGDTLVGGDVDTLVSVAADWGRLGPIVAVLSLDGGASFPDTIYRGAWSHRIPWTVPSGQSSDRCLIRAVVVDGAGNVGQAFSLGFFTMLPTPSGLDGSSEPRFTFSVCDLRCPGAVRLRYSVPVPTRARITVFDVGGRLVHVLVDAMVTPGVHEVVWSGGGLSARLPSGLYWAVFEAGTFRMTRRILLIR